ncbi:MAG: hypothetical protein WC928_01915 [Patescibacteria group bacterium]|jgi:hypothetical protein
MKKGFWLILILLLALLGFYFFSGKYSGNLFNFKKNTQPDIVYEVSAKEVVEEFMFHLTDPLSEDPSPSFAFSHLSEAGKKYLKAEEKNNNLSLMTGITKNPNLSYTLSDFVPEDFLTNANLNETGSIKVYLNYPDKLIEKTFVLSRVLNGERLVWLIDEIK